MTTTPSQFHTRVARTEVLTAHLIRVVVTGEELASFPATGPTDRYVKLIFPRPGVAFPEGTDLRSLPPAERPIVRTYTVRRFDPEANELTIDFVTHGKAGVAGPWAASAQPGDELMMTAPGGAYAPRPDVDLHLLIGDEAALPAIAATLETMPSGAKVLALLEVEDATEELILTTMADAEIMWLHRASDPGPDLLLDAVRDLDLPAGRIQAFAHGELLATRAMKRHLLDERGLDPELVSASGYWRRGKDEDGFQAEKRELARAEKSSG